MSMYAYALIIHVTYLHTHACCIDGYACIFMGSLPEHKYMHNHRCSMHVYASNINDQCLSIDAACMFRYVTQMVNAYTYPETLVEAAGKFSMLRPCMHSKFLIKKETNKSTHGEILKDYNAASNISINIENISTSLLPRSFCFHTYVSQVGTLCNHR